MMRRRTKAQRISFSALIKKNIDVGMTYRRWSAAQDVAWDATQEAIQYHETKTLNNDIMSTNLKIQHFQFMNVFFCII